MSVEVRVPGLLQRLVGGSRTVTGEGKTVRQLVDYLDKQYPGLKSRLLSEDGKLQPFVSLYLNDEDVRFMQELDTALKDGDVISVLPAVAGG